MNDALTSFIRFCYIMPRRAKDSFSSGLNHEFGRDFFVFCETFEKEETNISQLNP